MVLRLLRGSAVAGVAGPHRIQAARQRAEKCSYMVAGVCWTCMGCRLIDYIFRGLAGIERIF